MVVGALWASYPAGSLNPRPRRILSFRAAREGAEQPRWSLHLEAVNKQGTGVQKGENGQKQTTHKISRLTVGVQEAHVVEHDQECGQRDPHRHANELGGVVGVLDAIAQHRQAQAAAHGRRGHRGV